MNTTPQENAFDFSFADGENSISKSYGAGLVVRATLVPCPEDIPDEDIYTAADIAAWERDEWRFWDMVMEVLIGGQCIKRVGVLGGIDCVDDPWRNDAHLDSTANEQLRCLDVAGIVREYARKVTAAAEAAARA